MGLFDTPAIISSCLATLSKRTSADFDLDVTFKYDNENLFHIVHDYYDSPCYFKIVSWEKNRQGNFVFRLEKFPWDENELKIRSFSTSPDKLEVSVSAWQKSVLKLMTFENTHVDPKLNEIQSDFIKKLGLTDENASSLLNEVEKRHASQFCDHIQDILDSLDEKDFDHDKIKEIKFDLEKIQRDIESLKITTKGQLANSTIKVFSKIEFANIGRKIIEKAAGHANDKFISEIMERLLGS